MLRPSFCCSRYGFRVFLERLRSKSDYSVEQIPQGIYIYGTGIGCLCVCSGAQFLPFLEKMKGVSI